MSLPIKGLFPAMVTPLADDGRKINHSVTKKLCDFLISKGVNGIFGLGTTGEGVLLDIKERKKVTEIILTHVDNRLPVVVNVGHLTTENTIDLAIHASQAGVDGISICTPFYYHYSDEELIEFFKEIAIHVSDTYVYLYNIPQLTGNMINFNILRKLSEVENIVGIKESNGDTNYFKDFININFDDISIICGNDLLNYIFLLTGAAGIISSIASVFPEPYINLYKSIKESNEEQARRYQKEINKLVQVTNQGNIGLLKEALKLRGVDGGNVRSPLSSAKKEDIAQVRPYIEKYSENGGIN